LKKAQEIEGNFEISFRKVTIKNNIINGNIWKKKKYMKKELIE
jgi:hypothetical protein